MHCAEDRQARMRDNWAELPATLRRKRRPKMCQARLDEFYMSDSEIECCARHLESTNQQPLDKFNIMDYVANNNKDKVNKSVLPKEQINKQVIIAQVHSERVLENGQDTNEKEKEKNEIIDKNIEIHLESEKQDKQEDNKENENEEMKSNSNPSMENQKEMINSSLIKKEEEDKIEVDLMKDPKVNDGSKVNTSSESAIEDPTENITLVCVVSETGNLPLVQLTSPPPSTTSTMTRHSTLIAIPSESPLKEPSECQTLNNNKEGDMKKEMKEDITIVNDIGSAKLKEEINNHEDNKNNEEEFKNHNDHLSSKTVNKSPTISEGKEDNSSTSEGKDDGSSASESQTATVNDKSDMELFLKSAVSADSLMGSGGEDAASSGSSTGFEPVHDDSGTDEPTNEIPIYSTVSKISNNKSILYDSIPVEIPRVGLHRRQSLAEREALAFYDSILPVLSDDEEEESTTKESALTKPKPNLVEFKLPRVVRNARKRLGTITEETSSSSLEAEKMTVRDLLRRFEQISARNGDGCINILDEVEKSATLRDIQNALKSLEEKVRKYESKMQHKAAVTAPAPVDSADSECGGHRGGWAPAIVNGASPPPEASPPQSSLGAPPIHDGKHSLLQYALLHFRQTADKFDMLKTADGGIAAGSLQALQSLKAKRGGDDAWTWKEQVDLVKFTAAPIEQSLLRLDSPELNGLAVECFAAVMRYMGDLPLEPHLSEVECVYTILMHCHKHVELRDEVYCQLMKQTTSNRSPRADSAQRGWRLLSIVAAYFACSDTLRPYLFKYLETAAYDSRRACHGTAMVCLSNLRKTLKHGGRKNVPSVEELTAVSAGRNSKRQIYRLPGGSERVVNTRSTTVVADVIEEICNAIGVRNPHETEEFSLYCIVEGDAFTMPLARDEYILDVTTELHKNQQVFYLIFCRSVWHFPLRLDVPLYVEVVFNQIAPDYLEGLLLVMPGEQLAQEQIYELAKLAALLHRAADLTHIPTMKETKFLLPKPALSARDVKPAQWVHMVQGSWPEIQDQSATQAKAQVLETLSHWPLFGSSFFAVKRTSDPKDRGEHILALNRHGVHFIDLVTHETLLHYQFAEVISTRKVKSEDGTLFLDMKCGNLMQQRITRLQTDQAHEISRLIRQYITLEQRLRNT